MKNKMFSKLMAGALSAALLFSITAVPAFAEGPDKNDSDDRTVTVSGSGYATVTPDTAAVIFSISSKADTAKEAQDQNKTEADAVLAALKQLDLNEKDIRTSAYNLNPSYHYDDNGNAVVDGYTATTELTVSNQTIDMAGTVLTAGVNSGVNAVTSVNYSCSTYEDAYKQALAEAVKNARGKAEALALAADDTLGEVTSIIEGYEDTSLRSAKYADTMLESASADSAMDGITLMPGETQITANVSATYELDD